MKILSLVDPTEVGCVVCSSKGEQSSSLCDAHILTHGAHLGSYNCEDKERCRGKM